ncbi:hypothetical protein AAHB54_06340 [Bacillus cereus]
MFNLQGTNQVTCFHAFIVKRFRVFVRPSKNCKFTVYEAESIYLTMHLQRLVKAEHV